MSDWEEKYLYMVNSAEAYPPITVPDNPIMSHQVIQSIAERVCEVLRIEVGNVRIVHEQFDPSIPGMSLLEFEKFLSRTRDWTAILSEKEEK